jgi:hypothetical protein
MIRSAIPEEPVTAITTNILSHLPGVNWALAKMKFPEGIIMVIIKNIIKTCVTHPRNGFRSERTWLHAISYSKLESLLYARGAK